VVLLDEKKEENERLYAEAGHSKGQGRANNVDYEKPRQEEIRSESDAGGGGAKEAKAKISG